MVIYTIGRRLSYEEYFGMPDVPKKLGRIGPGIDDRFPDGYCGGSVWKTFQEAQSNAPDGYAVYGVHADWEKDTTKSNDGPWHDLLVSSPLIKLDMRPSTNSATP